MKKNALGRGLDALISMDDITVSGSSSINEIALDKITANPNQPRREFDPVALAELAASIAEIGIIQPITLRSMGEDTYQIIAGERRFRASKLAGIESIPAYVREAEDDTMLEMALIENIQREDLNAIEIALTFQNLIEQYHFTQEQMSDRVGKKRATIANYLRLLKLPAEVQLGLKNREIEMGHARAILSVDSPALQLKLYNETLKNHYSVRKVEEVAKQYANGEVTNNPTTDKSAEKNELFEPLCKQLSHFFNSEVKFACTPKGNGKITISFKNETELEHIISQLDQLN